MSWLILILSGALEAVWAAALHRTSQATGRHRLVPGLVFLVSVIASTGGLAVAMQSIPTGTAYAVWVGMDCMATARPPVLARTEARKTRAGTSRRRPVAWAVRCRAAAQTASSAPERMSISHDMTAPVASLVACRVLNRRPEARKRGLGLQV